MFTNRVLSDFGELVTVIDAHLSRFPTKFRYCSLEALTNSSSPLFCIVRTGMAGPSEAKFLDYGQLQLRREVFADTELRGRLETTITNGKLGANGGGIDFDFTRSLPRQSFHSSGSEYHQWPGSLLEFYPIKQSSSVSLQMPLVGRGLPPFFDPKDAFRHWAKLRVSDTDGRYGRLLLFIPNFAARLRKLSFGDSILRVKSEFESDTLADISVLATDGQAMYRKTRLARKSETFRIMSNPTSLRVLLTAENGDVLDQFAEEHTYATKERVIFAGRRDAEVSTDLIRRGESDSVEFKVFVRLDDTKKVAELVRTVIAFANTTGGRLFIGITDDGDIEGVDGQIPHISQDTSAFSGAYFARLRSILQQKLNRIPTIELSSEGIGGKTIFVMNVEEGQSKPYFDMQTREIFVRRGASNMRPDPDSDFRRLLGSRDAFGLSEFDLGV